MKFPINKCLYVDCKYIEQNHTDLVNTKIETSKLDPIMASEIRYRLGDRYVHTVNDLIYSNII